MPDEPDGYPELLLAGSDRPRPLPPGMRARLEEALAELSPRPLSVDVRDRLKSTLSAPEQGPAPRRGRWKWRPLAVTAGAAAAIALVAGLLVPGLVHERGAPTAAKPLAPRAELGLPAGHVPKGAKSVASTAQAVRPGVAKPPTAGASVGFAAGSALNEPVMVLGLVPSSGPTSGGNWVSLSGPGLYRIDYVVFGTSRAKKVERVSLSEVKVLAPAHAPGTVYVRAHSAKGTSAASAATRYTYLARASR